MDEVVALGLEAWVGLEADEDVEVARRAAAHPSLALARDAELLAVVDAGRDVQGEVRLLALAALAAAARAHLVDRLARAAAARARRHVHEPAEHRLLDLTDLAAPVALRARRDRGARLRAIAAAAFALLEPRDLDRAIAAPHRVDELDLELHPQVRAAHRPTLAAAGLAAEEGVEQVVDAESGRAVGVPEHVVALPPLRVREHLVRLRHLAEPRGRLVRAVHVGVVLARELAVRAADLVLGRLAGHAEDAVVIGAGHGPIIGGASGAPGTAGARLTSTSPAPEYRSGGSHASAVRVRARPDARDARVRGSCVRLRRAHRPQRRREPAPPDDVPRLPPRRPALRPRVPVRGRWRQVRLPHPAPPRALERRTRRRA